MQVNTRRVLGGAYSPKEFIATGCTSRVWWPVSPAAVKLATFEPKDGLVSQSRVPGAVAQLTGVLATAVEFVKLYHWPRLDAFRLMLPSVLLLGRFFSGWEIAAYWLASSPVPWLISASGGVLYGPEFARSQHRWKSAMRRTGCRWTHHPGTGAVEQPSEAELVETGG